MFVKTDTDRTALSKKNILNCLIIWLSFTAGILVMIFSGMLTSLNFKVAGGTSFLSYIGFGVLIAALLFAIFIYMLFEQRTYLKEAKYLVIVYLGIALTIIISEAIAIHISPYMRPLFLAAFLVCVLLNGRVGLIVNFITNIVIFVVRLASNENFALLAPEVALLLVGLVAGTIVVELTNKNRRRIEYLFIALFLSLQIVAFSLIATMLFPTSELVSIALYSFASGFVNVFLFLGLLPLFETVFNVVTNFRLGEITDVNMPLLKRLKTEAPGTFNHSLVLSNIAEACASAIGENTYLARAAAFYHDIGKLKNPQYFVENQSPGNNPHDDLSPEMSVSLIKKHIQNGVALAKEYKLPPEIVGVIKEHHGTLPIMFFYHKAQKYTDGLLDESGFRYDGPVPQSKIAAIIMIADGAEAAVRAAQNAPSEVKEKIVADIISDRMKRGQFDECDITMSDLYKIKETILTTFVGVFHERIAYPQGAKTEEK